MSSFLESIFGRVGGARRAGIITLGVVVAAAVLGISQWATRPTMVPLYADLPVDATGPLTDLLDEAGVAYALERGGTTILVDAADVAKARVAVARAPLPRAGDPGFELFEQSAWGMTDFTQRINYQRALEGELEHTIGTIEGVAAVDVHLVLEEQKLFATDQREPKAAVRLTMARNANADAEMVEGLQRLVASAVGGLQPAQVTIVDARGRPLTVVDDPTIPGQSTRQLAVRRELEQELVHKASAMLDGIVGTGNYKVSVAADLNFDAFAQETHAVDPEQQVVATEQKAEVIPGTPEQGAASTTTATQFETTRRVERLERRSPTITRLNVSVLVADAVTLPPVGDTLAQPVVTPRSAEELQRIEALVRTAVGVDAARGDQLAVYSAPFELPVLPAPPVADSLATPTIADRLLENPKPAIAIAAIVALLVLALVFLRALKPPPAPAVPAALPEPAPAAGQLAAGAAADDDDLDALDGGAAASVPALPERAPVVLPPPPTTPEREQAIATVEQRPDAAVRVVRAWLRD